MASLTIRPGSQVRLKGQSEDVPDFLVVRCEGDQCWVRQQTWKPDAELHIRITQIAIPEAEGVRSHPPCQVISLNEYRMRRKG